MRDGLNLETWCIQSSHMWRGVWTLQWPRLLQSCHSICRNLQMTPTSKLGVGVKAVELSPIFMYMWAKERQTWNCPQARRWGHFQAEYEKKNPTFNHLAVNTASFWCHIQLIITLKGQMGATKTREITQRQQLQRRQQQRVFPPLSPRLSDSEDGEKVQRLSLRPSISGKLHAHAHRSEEPLGRDTHTPRAAANNTFAEHVRETQKQVWRSRARRPFLWHHFYDSVWTLWFWKAALRTACAFENTRAARLWRWNWRTNVWSQALTVILCLVRDSRLKCVSCKNPKWRENTHTDVHEHTTQVWKETHTLGGHSDPAICCCNQTPKGWQTHSHTHTHTLTLMYVKFTCAHTSNTHGFY